MSSEQEKIKEAAQFLASISQWKQSDQFEYIQSYISCPIQSEAAPQHKNINISYKYYKQAAKPRGILFMFHGIGSCASLNAPTANIFASAPYNLDVIAFDQIGHGLSQGLVNNLVMPRNDNSKPQGPDVYIPDYKLLIQIGWHIVEEICEKEVSRLGEAPTVFLNGRSMGGGTIAHMMLEHGLKYRRKQFKISGLILEAPYVDLVNKPGSFLQFALKGVSWLSPQIIVTQPAFDSISRIPEQVELRQKHPEAHAIGFTATTSEQMLKFSQDAIDALQKDKLKSNNCCPVLILQGTDDATTTVAGAQMIIDWCANQDKEMKMYKDGRHSLTMDLCAREVFDDMGKWILKHL